MDAGELSSLFEKIVLNGDRRAHLRLTASGSTSHEVLPDAVRQAGDGARATCSCRPGQLDGVPAGDALDAGLLLRGDRLDAGAIHVLIRLDVHAADMTGIAFHASTGHPRSSAGSARIWTCARRHVRCVDTSAATA